jgi:glucosylceramidase
MVDRLNTSDVLRPAEVSRRDFVKSSAASVGAAAALYTTPLTAAAHLVAPAMAGPIRVWQTTGTERHAAHPDLSWRAGGGTAPTDVVVDPQHRKQEVLGFGGAFTDAATYTFNQLAPAARAALFRELFHPGEMNLSVGRTCIGSSDYSTVAYSYDDSPTPDPELTNFSIAHDRQWILPMLREARAVNPELFLLSSPWSPPGWMKDNNSLLGGTIRRRYLGQYANYVTKFVQAYGAEGVRVDAVT